MEPESPEVVTKARGRSASRGKGEWMQTWSGVTLIAKFCINIAFFGCRTHFSHIAVSLYAK